uniref:SusC/RagA family TonB-linked outer membrane protein n=1 Tax=uncultured Draconibacterium sp. TaxID=1573823 RepID=UPI003218062B
MRKILFVFAMCFGLLSSALAQQTVTGTVIGEDGLTLPGVSVVEKGTSNGTITDIDGKYSITVPADAILAFSFVGMEAQEIEVGGRSTIDVTLVTSAIGLDEVVVTALGIKREEKTLTYAQQTVAADELVKSKDMNFVNSLSGKAAGVEIKKSSSGAGGSTRLVLRGSKSLSGDSEPLFVIDGIPMANNKGGQPGMWGGTDGGDGLSQINPEDIESISFLKGSNAAVLYGSQGANGVVVITTKSGKAGKARVSINSGVTFEDVMKMPELQYNYGAEGGAKESWSTTSGNYDDKFVEDFFETGVNFLNSVTISGGNERTTAYFSYANTSSTGITPENRYEKNNVTFKQSTKLFNDKVLVSSNVMLANELTENRNPAGYYLNPLTGLYMFPRNGIDGNGMDYYKANYEYFLASRNMMWQNWFVDDHHQSNPYWIINKEPSENKTKRVIANLSLSWDITEHLNFGVRGNYDYADRQREQKHFAGSNGTNVHENGRWEYSNYTDELIYADGLLKYDNEFGDFTVNAVAGASYQKTTYGLGVSVNTNTDGLIYPNEFFFQNIPTNVLVNSTLSSRKVKQALFANASVGFKEMLFLDLSGRNDWASTLAKTGNDSYFYPAVGLTAIVSEMAEMPDWITFGKVRASHTTVANEVPFNRVDPQNTINAGGGVNRNTTKPFTDLKPEKLNSLEIGTDWRFFDGRLGFDFTYYNINSKDQFLSLTAPSGSGYTTYFINAGEIVNKGIELTVDATPVKKGKLAWKTAFNFSKNDNEIVELHPDISFLNLGSSEGYSARIQEGGSIGDLYVYKFRRNEAGKILFDDNGKPLKTANRELMGNLEPDWSLGWNNSITYGNLDFSFLINAKIGGKAFSQTESMLDGAGVSQRSGEARDLGYVEVDGVVESSGAAVTQVDPETWYRAIGDRNGVGEPYVYNRTNVRLGQFALSYNFNLTKVNLPIDALTCSLVGQNLFFIYLDAPFDPELAMSTNRNAQSLDNFNLPTTRTIGFNVKLTF